MGVNTSCHLFRQFTGWKGWWCSPSIGPVLHFNTSGLLNGWPLTLLSTEKKNNQPSTQKIHYWFSEHARCRANEHIPTSLALIPCYARLPHHCNPIGDQNSKRKEKAKKFSRKRESVRRDRNSVLGCCQCGCLPLTATFYLRTAKVLCNVEWQSSRSSR